MRRHPDFLTIVAAELRRCLLSTSTSTGSSSADTTDALSQALAGMGLEERAAATSADEGASAGVVAAAVAEASGEHGDASSTSPSLFPLILLLSRLRPPTESLAEDEQGSSLDQALKDCLPYVARCACLPDGLMRLTAARAFSSLVGTTRCGLLFGGTGLVCLHSSHSHTH